MCTTEDISFFSSFFLSPTDILPGYFLTSFTTGIKICGAQTGREIPIPADRSEHNLMNQQMTHTNDGHRGQNGMAMKFMLN